MTHWVRILAQADVPVDRPTRARINERDLAVVRCEQGGAPHVLDDRCPHRGGQLSDGSVRGDDIVCPLHEYDFDLHTGISRYDPHERVAVYSARVVDGHVEVDADAVPPLPTGHDAGYLGAWQRPSDPGLRAYGYLRGLASGAPPISAMGSARALRPSWDDILLLPGQVSHPPRLDEEPLSLRTVIGRSAARPLVLDVPMFVSHMSFGALSASAKTALARVAAQTGTAIGSGEGGMLDAERSAASRYIFEMASGYFGWTPENIGRADAVELKFGQSAKAGSGGAAPRLEGHAADRRGARAAAGQGRALPGAVRGPGRSGGVARSDHRDPRPDRWPPGWHQIRRWSCRGRRGCCRGGGRRLHHR